MWVSQNLKILFSFARLVKAALERSREERERGGGEDLLRWERRGRDWQWKSWDNGWACPVLSGPGQGGLSMGRLEQLTSRFRVFFFFLITSSALYVRLLKAAIEKEGRRRLVQPLGRIIFIQEIFIIPGHGWRKWQLKKMGCSLLCGLKWLHSPQGKPRGVVFHQDAVKVTVLEIKSLLRYQGNKCV